MLVAGACLTQSGHVPGVCFVSGIYPFPGLVVGNVNYVVSAIPARERTARECQRVTGGQNRDV